LELEGAIERRYLKAPLGATRTTSLSNITASTERNKQDTTLDLDEKVGFVFGIYYIQV